MPDFQTPSAERDPSRWFPHSPFRRPEWRWRRAECLAATGRRLDRRVDDGWVTAARRVLTGRGVKAGSEAVHGAHAVWAGDPERRAELEAWLLTAEPPADVARLFALPEAVVNAYERVFFAVRGEAERATDWRLLQAVGYNPWDGFTGPLPHSAWKYAAATGGPLALRVVLAATTGRPLPAEVAPAGEGDAGASVREETLLLVAALAARTDAEFADVLRRHRISRSAVSTTVATYDPMREAQEDFLLTLPRLTRQPGRQPTEGPGDEEAEAHGRTKSPAPAVQRFARRPPCRG